MSSTLSRLYGFAKGTKIESLENFTTEALAAAVRQDPRPLVIVLRDHGLLRYDQEPSEVNVETQVAVAGAGIVDLIVEARGRDWSNEIWVEVKVGAGESGMQLANYALWAAGRPLPPRIAVLASRPLPGHEDLPFIPWQAIWLAVPPIRASSPHWHDLKLFLEEIHVADEFGTPIVAREAASLLDAQALLRKTSRLLQITMDEGRGRWPNLGWPKTVNDLDEQLLWQLHRFGRIVAPVGTAARGVTICLGVVQHEASAGFDHPEPQLAVWIDQPPRQTELRRRLLAQAEVEQLTAAWIRRLQGWWALEAHQRLTAFATADAASAWLLDRMSELDASGVLRVLLSKS